MDEDEDDSGNAMDRGIDIDDNETPVARLIRVWRDERHSPDILRFQGDLLDSLLEKLHEQVSPHFAVNLSATFAYFNN